MFNLRKGDKVSQTQTKPGHTVVEQIAAKVQLQIPEGATATSGTGRMDFERVQGILSDRPLRAISPGINYEDADDARAAREALADPERIPYDAVRKELGLEDG